MTTWGYRIHTFVTKYGRDELFLNGSEERDAIFGLFRAVEDRKILRGLPARQAITDGESGDPQDDSDEVYSPSTPTLKIKSLDWASDNHMHLVAGIGDAGLHEDLSDPDSQTSTNIQRMAAEVSLRVDVLFPDEGSNGIIISETQGMRDPVGRLLKWATQLWKEEKGERLREAKARREAWEALKKSGVEDIGDRPQIPNEKNYTFKTSRLADPELLRKIIQDAKEGSAEFFEMGPDGTRKHTLTRKLSTAQEIGYVGKLLQSGFGSTNDLSSVADQAVLVLADDLGYDVEELGNGGVAVDDAKVRLKSDQMSATFSSTQASDVFTYKFHNGRPKDLGFYSVCLGKVTRLAEPAGIEISLDAAEEVVQWLQTEVSRSPSDLMS